MEEKAIHPNEPSLEELLEIQSELIEIAKRPDDIKDKHLHLKQLDAINKQVKRRRAA